jgi:hypothetical protein
MSPVITMKRIILQNEDDWDIIVSPRRSATRENRRALAKDDKKMIEKTSVTRILALILNISKV